MSVSATRIFILQSTLETNLPIAVQGPSDPGVGPEPAKVCRITILFCHCISYIRLIMCHEQGSHVLVGSLTNDLSNHFDAYVLLHEVGQVINDSGQSIC